MSYDYNGHPCPKCSGGKLRYDGLWGLFVRWACDNCRRALSAPWEPKLGGYKSTSPGIWG